jgi:hypothetical protein
VHDTTTPAPLDTLAEALAGLDQAEASRDADDPTAVYVARSAVIAAARMVIAARVEPGITVTITPAGRPDSPLRQEPVPLPDWWGPPVPDPRSAVIERLTAFIDAHNAMSQVDDKAARRAVLRSGRALVEAIAKHGVNLLAPHEVERLERVEADAAQYRLLHGRVEQLHRILGAALQEGGGHDFLLAEAAACGCRTEGGA